MSTDVKDGGPAFPHVNPGFDGNWDKEPQRGGMTLRDYFAAKAMQAILHTVLDRAASLPSWEQTKLIAAEAKSMPDTAYVIADAMLKHRSQP